MGCGILETSTRKMQRLDLIDLLGQIILEMCHLIRQRHFKQNQETLEKLVLLEYSIMLENELINLYYIISIKLSYITSYLNL